MLIPRALVIMALVLAGARAVAQDGGMVDVAGQAHPAPGHSTGGLDVLVFTCHDCPICQSYSGEIQRIADAYADRPVRVYVVLEEEGFSTAEAQAWARDFKLRCAVILDDDRRLARLAQARTTPEVAVFNDTGGIAYLGRIDDGWAGLNRRRDQPATHDLRAALDALLAGQAPATARTTAIGCVITAMKPSPPGASP